MKKYITSLLLLWVTSGQSIAQQNASTPLNDSMPIFQIKNQPRFYINVHGGFSVGLGSTFKFYPDDISSVSVQQIESSPEIRAVKYKEKAQGLGNGLRVGVGFSYIINDFVNVGIDVDYFRSTISKDRDSSYRRVKTMTGGVDELIYNEKYTISYEATLISLSPNITFKAISRPRFFIYNKVGAVVIFRPNSIQRETQDGDFRMGWQGFFRDSSTLTEKKYEWGLKNPAFGFMGGLGAQGKVTEKIRIFGELQFTHIVFKVRNRVLTDLNVDGTQKINTLPLSQREIVFKKSFSSNEAGGNPDRPTIATYQRFPITYVGLQAGIAYRF